MCGPPRYRPSAVQCTIFCCQANKWLVSEAESVYWLLIWSLSGGCVLNFAFSVALLYDWQSPDFIDFLPQCSLSKYPSATLKDLRRCSTSVASHDSSYDLPLVLVFFLFPEAGGMIGSVSGKWSENTIYTLCISLYCFFPLYLSLFLFWHRENIVHRLASHWIRVVIHRPISNCQAAKLHRVCQNSSQEHAGDVKN